LLLTHLALSNVRNYAQLDLAPAPGLNLFVGDNAQGKSNLLEAIAMLGTGKSFRTTRDTDIVREGMELAVVRGEAQVRAGAIQLVCTIVKSARATRKSYTVNGRGVRYAGFLGKIRVVTFVPRDLLLASGPPSLRRSLLNEALAQDDARYYREYARYRRALTQKNALLREPVVDEELLAIYDRTLVEAGTAVMLARSAFTLALAPLAAQAHGRFSGGRERLELRYEPSIVAEAPTADAIADAFTQRLAAVAPAERARRGALAGPHRDDLSLLIDDRPIAAYGSQGQQRTAVLALKVAEYTVMRDRANEAPLLLLDDVLSELDEGRSEAFLAGLGDFEQAFVTAAAPVGATTGRRYRIAAAQVVAA
jgi:DNA replication and repair protein RecF